MPSCTSSPPSSTTYSGINRVHRGVGHKQAVGHQQVENEVQRPKPRLHERRHPSGHPITDDKTMSDRDCARDLPA